MSTETSKEAFLDYLAKLQHMQVSALEKGRCSIRMTAQRWKFLHSPGVTDYSLTIAVFAQTEWGQTRQAEDGSAIIELFYIDTWSTPEENKATFERIVKTIETYSAL